VLGAGALVDRALRFFANRSCDLPANCHTFIDLLPFHP
jgi:hypothetical protein